MSEKIRTCALRLRAAALQPARPAHRERAGAAGAALQPGADPVGAAGAGRAGGALQLQAGDACRFAAPDASLAASTTSASPRRAWPPVCVSASWRARWARRRGSWHCCGARTSRRSPARSSAHARPAAGGAAAGDGDDAERRGAPRLRRDQPARRGDHEFLQLSAVDEDADQINPRIVYTIYFIDTISPACYNDFKQKL